VNETSTTIIKEKFLNDTRGNDLEGNNVEAETIRSQAPSIVNCKQFMKMEKVQRLNGSGLFVKFALQIL
jgi:hypothetical protein